MSSVNYTIVDYDNDLDEFLVVYTHADEQHRILVPPVVEEGAINEQSTKNAIAAAIRERHAPPPSTPTGVSSLVGSTGNAPLATESV